MFECVLNDIKLQRTPQYHLKMSIVAYFLSEYDMQAVKDLGYKSRAEAHREISAVFNVFGNYL